MNKNKVIAQAEYNAKCSTTSCKNFLDITCIFNNVYSKHVFQFCLFVLVVLILILLVILTILKIHLTRYKLVLLMLVIILIGTLVPFILSLTLKD